MRRVSAQHRMPVPKAPMICRACETVSAGLRAAARLDAAQAQAPDYLPAGFQNSATGSDLGL